VAVDHQIRVQAEGDERSRTGVSRLLAFSDGVFAIAITLLVLDLGVADNLTDEELSDELVDQLPNVFAALLSFALIGRFWVAHHRLYTPVVRADTWLLVLNLLFLAPIAFLPFGARLIAEYGTESVAVIVYAGLVAVCGLFEALMWWHIVRRRLTRPPPDRTEVINTYIGILLPAGLFLLSIPIALISAPAALYSWLLLLVVGPVRRWHRHANRA
jgi:uncharacterized membrane protein